MSSRCIIVGASHAASQLALSVRKEGWEGEILVIGEEFVIPYHRPPLSKDLLAGEKRLEETYIRPMSVYEKDNIRFMLNMRVQTINTKVKTITLSDGEELGYDKLALTVGSRVREVVLPGVELDGIHYLRNINDVDNMRNDIRPGAKAVIVGGGYIGLETAAVLRKLGMEVRVLEMMERILQRVTAQEISEFYTRIHTEEGVNIHCGVGVTGFKGNDKVQKVLCTDGSEYDADMVVIGVGIIPNVELAQEAGLNINNGIVVDEYARTSEPDIVAAGDCAYHYNPLYKRWLRLESVQNATDQAKIAAMTICGKKQVYNALPWFWSDQYDLKLQIAGLSQGYDEVVTRGDRENSRSFAAFYLQAGKLIATDAVNRPAEYMMSRKIIAEGINVDINKLVDDSIHPREFVKS